MTAFTKLNDELIEIIDVEKIMSEVVGADDIVSNNLVDNFTS
jgi:two-component system chemotaxis response regulator CheV